MEGETEELVPPGLEEEERLKCSVKDKLEHYSNPILGMEYLVELFSEQEKTLRFFCALCDKRGDIHNILNHMSNSAHYTLYLRKYFPRLYKLYCDLPKSNDMKYKVGLVMNHLLRALEHKYGRLSPSVVREEIVINPASKLLLLRKLETGPHIRESQLSENLESILNLDYLQHPENLQKDFPLPHKPKATLIEPAKSPPKMETPVKLETPPKPITDLPETITGNAKEAKRLESIPMVVAKSSQLSPVVISKRKVSDVDNISPRSSKSDKSISPDVVCIEEPLSVGPSSRTSANKNKRGLRSMLEEMSPKRGRSRSPQTRGRSPHLRGRGRRSPSSSRMSSRHRRHRRSRSMDARRPHHTRRSPSHHRVRRSHRSRSHSRSRSHGRRHRRSGSRTLSRRRSSSATRAQHLVPVSSHSRSSSASPLQSRGRTKSRTKSIPHGHAHNSKNVDSCDRDLQRKYQEEMRAKETYLNAKKEYYSKHSEKHPAYQQEWEKFWNRRYKELLQEGIHDPKTYDYKPDWIVVWSRRLNEMHDAVLNEYKAELMRKYDLLRRGKSPLHPSQMRKPWTVAEVDLTSRRSPSTSPRRSVSSSSNRSRSPLSRSGSPRAQRSFTRSPSVTEKSFQWRMMDVLRSLSVLEHLLGTFASHVMTMLTSAVAMEKSIPGSSEDLATPENIVFLDTIQEKLKGQLMANMIKKNLVRAVRYAIDKINDYLTMIAKTRTRVMNQPTHLPAAMMVRPPGPMMPMPPHYSYPPPQMHVPPPAQMPPLALHPGYRGLPQPVSHPVPQSVLQPVPQPVTQPMPQPVAQPVPKPVPQPIAQPARQPVPQPVPQPAPAPQQVIKSERIDLPPAASRPVEPVEKEQKPTPPPNYGVHVKPIDKIDIAQRIAKRLMDAGETDIQEDELHSLIKSSIKNIQTLYQKRYDDEKQRLAEIKAAASRTVTPPPIVIKKEKEEDDKIKTEPPAAKEKSATPPPKNAKEDGVELSDTAKAMESLSEEDLGNLLLNFNDLTREEQLGLIELLKKFEKTDPAKVERLKNIIGDVDDSDNEEREQQPPKKEEQAAHDSDDDYSLDDVYNAASKNVAEQITKTLNPETEHLLSNIKSWLPNLTNVQGKSSPGGTNSNGYDSNFLNSVISALNLREPQVRSNIAGPSSSTVMNGGDAQLVQEVGKPFAQAQSVGMQQPLPSQPALPPNPLSSGGHLMAQHTQSGYYNPSSSNAGTYGNYPLGVDPQASNYNQQVSTYLKPSGAPFPGYQTINKGN